MKSFVRRVPLAIVQHANQYLITDGYDNREGITQVLAGFSELLRFHERFRVPINLHLSGTLIEAIAWHQPEFFQLVKRLRQEGLLALIGGTYAESVMTLFPARFNLRQLNEFFWLYRRHLDCDPDELNVVWVPERVWNTGKLAPVLTSRRLQNGGYRFVLLDDRLLYPTAGSYPGSPRARFDCAGPYGSAAEAACASLDGEEASAQAFDPVEYARIYSIRDGQGLVVAPISANLRYWVPPSSPDHWRLLEETVASLGRRMGEDNLLVYADDMEKSAGVGPWGRGSIDRYREFLRWVVSHEELESVLLPQWLAGHPPLAEWAVERGTFFELAQSWQAGEDYETWWRDAGWLAHRKRLSSTLGSLVRLERENAEPALRELAWKHALASTYETAWHGASYDGLDTAPWARALASHARSVEVIAAAARWFGSGGSDRPLAEVIDIDADGNREIILKNADLYAVFSPRYGGRLLYLFARSPEGGAMLIGNPTDDWNWLERVNDYQDMPPNHPGALADVGLEHSRFEIVRIDQNDAYAFAELVTVIDGDRTVRKRLLLGKPDPVLTVCYELDPPIDGFATEIAFSPDYYRLLRDGRMSMEPYSGRVWRGARVGDRRIWAALAEDEETVWSAAKQPESGHAMNVRVGTDEPHFHLVIGAGTADETTCRQAINRGKRVIHQRAQRPTARQPAKADRAA